MHDCVCEGGGKGSLGCTHFSLALGVEHKQICLKQHLKVKAMTIAIGNTCTF